MGGRVLHHPYIQRLLYLLVPEGRLLSESCEGPDDAHVNYVAPAALIPHPLVIHHCCNSRAPAYMSSVPHLPCHPQPQDLIVYAIITVCDVGSLALCCVLAIVSLYYLILYKLQVGSQESMASLCLAEQVDEPCQ